MFSVQCSVNASGKPLDLKRRNMLVFNNLILLKELSMPACATRKTIADQPTISNLFLPVPDTDFRGYLDEDDEHRDHGTGASMAGHRWPDQGPLPAEMPPKRPLTAQAAPEH